MNLFNRFLLLTSVLGASVAPVAAQTYDYIVVGAGAAGIIVAERLAESGKQTLLIERGHASTFSTGGTALVSWNNSLTIYDVPGVGFWLGSLNDPQGNRYCTDTAGAAGCILGGGTEVNLMAFIRPQDADFENWPAGWKAANLRGAMNRLYTRNPGTITPSMDGKHYDQGAYNVVSQFLRGLGWTSVNSIAEPNLKTRTYSYFAANVANGLRQGPVKSYLPLAQARGNFRLMINTKVIRITRNGGTMTGVVIQRADGTRATIRLKAGGKVVLAAGTMSSPRLLWNSGIGRPAQINIVKSGSQNLVLPPQSQWINLPVGENLRNHVQVELPFRTKRSIVFRGKDDYLSPSQADINLYEQQASGILTQPGQRLNFWDHLAGSDGRQRYFQGMAYPTSANSVTIRMVMSLGITSTGILGVQPNGATIFSQVPEMNTAADRNAFGNYVDNFIAQTKRTASTITYTGSVTGQSIINGGWKGGLHWIGTCKMGTDSGLNGGTSVVDLNTKVYGTTNLYVVDGSIHPELPTGNTMAPIMVVAEEAATRILAA